MIGATGLVGRSLAVRLLEDEAVELHAVGRRASGMAHPRLRDHVAPPEDWPVIARSVGASVAVSALGTTWRAAGSQAAFCAVDLGMVEAFARAARAAGAGRMLTVSVTGADAGSSNFYLRTKGEAERMLEALGFDRLDILRPGLLRGPRGGERRIVERIAVAASPITDLLLRGRYARFAAIDADVVADAGAACVRSEAPGLFVHDNAALRALAERLHFRRRIG